ncbi:MAG: hypothetical protein AAF772_14735 [Acidobacteriota bacterium]
MPTLKPTTIDDLHARADDPVFGDARQAARILLSVRTVGGADAALDGEPQLRRVLQLGAHPLDLAYALLRHTEERGPRDVAREALVAAVRSLARHAPRGEGLALFPHRLRAADGRTLDAPLALLISRSLLRVELVTPDDDAPPLRRYRLTEMGCTRADLVAADRSALAPERARLAYVVRHLGDWLTTPDALDRHLRDTADHLDILRRDDRLRAEDDPLQHYFHTVIGQPLF